MGCVPNTAQNELYRKYKKVKWRQISIHQLINLVKSQATTKKVVHSPNKPAPFPKKVADSTDARKDIRDMHEARGAYGISIGTLNDI